MNVQLGDCFNGKTIIRIFMCINTWHAPENTITINR